jgi:hypothetical protein
LEKTIMFTRILAFVGAVTFLSLTVVCLFAQLPVQPQSTANAQSPATPTAIAPAPTATQPSADVPLGLWQCDYFANRDFAGQPAFTKVQPSPNFTARHGDLPNRLSAAEFAVRCVGHYAIGTLDTFIVNTKARGAVRVTIDGVSVINAWTVGTHDVSGNVTLSDGVHTFVTEFYTDIGRPSLSLDWQPGCTAWEGRFYNNPGFQGAPAYKRCDGNANSPLLIDVGAGVLASYLGADNVSAMWEQDVYFAAGTYQFNVDVDDDVQISIDRQIPFEKKGQPGMHTFVKRLRTGKHHIQVLLTERSGDARIKLTWQRQ